MHLLLGMKQNNGLILYHAREGMYQKAKSSISLVPVFDGLQKRMAKLSSALKVFLQIILLGIFYNRIYKSGPIQVVGFPRLDQPRVRIKGPLKTSYRSLYWAVLLNGENTSNHITLTFASSCLFCIPSNLSLP